MTRRLLTLLLCTAFLMLPLSALAIESEPSDGYVYVQPTLASDALQWDDRHPEILDPSMLYAKSAILILANTGDVLFEKNADEIMFPASTTKILTAYIALNMADDLENEMVTISQQAIDLVPSTYATVPFSAGETVSLKDLVGAMLVRSGNEAANAIAEYFSGSNENFSTLMNTVAQMLGCSQDTHFVNPSGVQDERHYTTARDMAIIARAAMQLPEFREIVKSNKYEIAASDKRPARTVTGGTAILDSSSEYYYSYADGIKTGFTNAAGRCFVGSASMGDIHLISVVFYSSNSGYWLDTARMFRYGFTQIQSISPESLYAEDPRVVDITGFSLDDPYHGELTLAIRAVDETKNMTIVGDAAKLNLLRENFNTISSIRWTHEFRAPIAAGEEIGILTFYAEDGTTAEYQLIATRSIEKRENAPPTLEQIEIYTAEDENIWPRFSIDLLIPPTAFLLLLLLLICGLRKIRRKRPKRVKLDQNRKHRKYVS